MRWILLEFAIESKVSHNKALEFCMKTLYLLSFLYVCPPVVAMRMEPHAELWEHLKAFNGWRTREQQILSLMKVANINPNYRQDGISLLNWTVFNGTLPMCAQLIQLGAIVNQAVYDTPRGWYQDEIGPTPFVTAVQQWKESLAIFFLQNGANPHQCGPNNDDKPLLLAIRRRMRTLCSLLLSRGADANTRMQDGTSAVAYAYANGWQEGAGLLRYCGASE